MRFYEVTLERGDERRHVRVPSPTDVQAADAAVPLMKPGESIAGIRELEDDGTQQTDAGPPKSQAAEFAPVTPGSAAAPHRA
jgi:hypothetical protein